MYQHFFFGKEYKKGYFFVLNVNKKKELNYCFTNFFLKALS